MLSAPSGGGWSPIPRTDSTTLGANEPADATQHGHPLSNATNTSSPRIDYPNKATQPYATQSSQPAPTAAPSAFLPADSTVALSPEQESQAKALAAKLSMPVPTVESMTVAMMKWRPWKKGPSELPPKIAAEILDKATKELFGRPPTKTELVDVLISYHDKIGKKLSPTEAADAADEGIKGLNEKEEGDGQSEFSSLAHGASDAFGSLRHPIDALGNGNPLPALVDTGAVVAIGAAAVASLPADALIAVGAGVVAGFGALASEF